MPMQQIALVSANNKAWKALEREKNKTIEVTSVIAACIASNRQLKEVKDAGKSVRKYLGVNRWHASSRPTTLNQFQPLTWHNDT